MARDLNLNVILRAADKATKPLRAIERGSGKTARALKASRSQLRQLEAAQKDLRGFQRLKRGSQETSRALETQQAKIRELSRAIETTQGPTRRLTQQRNAAIRTARKLKRQYESEQRELHELRRNMTRVDGVTGSYSQQQRELARRVANTNRQIERQQQHLARVARRQERAAAAARRYQRAQERAGRMAGAGAGALAAGGVGLYAGARLLAPGISYGEQISELQAVARLQRDDPRFAMLARQSRELGSSTQFSATEAAAGQTFLARAGFTPEAIRSSMRDVLDLALAGKMDLGRAADISSNIASAFKIDPEVEGNMQRVADTLTATATRANVDLEMLGETMKYLGQAEGLDVSLEQAAAMAGMLGNIGIQGSMAGTTMRAMLTRLSAPTKAARAAMAELDLEVTDSAGNLREIPDILADIAKATKDMGNAQRAQYLSDIFGQRAGSGMAELIAQEGTGGLTKFSDILRDAAGENARVAATMADNIGGDLKALGSAWEEIGISVTDVNAGPLRDLIQNATELLRGIGDWIKANPRLASTLTIVAYGLAAVVAVGGALTLTLASLLGPIALVRYGLTLLGTGALPAVLGGLKAISAFLLANPLGIAITLLAGAAYLIYRNWGPIADFFGGLWQDIKAAVGEGILGITRLLLDWSPLGFVWRTITLGLQALGIEIPEKFRTLGGAIIDGLVGGLLAKGAWLKDQVAGLAGKVGGWFKGVLGISSPSRVFMGYGRDTLEGYRQGLVQREDTALAQVDTLGRRLRRAGAGLGLGLAAGTVGALDTGEIRFDTRPPVAGAPAAGGGVTIQGGIHVHAAPGMDERALARYVAAEVERRLAEAERERDHRRRSALYDTE